MAAVTDFFGADNALRIFHEHIAGLKIHESFPIGPEIVQPHYMADNTISL
jgi:hypothetical protein